MDNNKVTGIAGSVVGKSGNGVKLRLEDNATEWFNYGKDEKAAEGYKAVTKDLAIGDLVVVDAVAQKKNDKTYYYLRSIKPKNGAAPAKEDTKKTTEIVDLNGIAVQLNSILSTVSRMEQKQNNMENEFVVLKDSLRNLAGGVGHLTPSEKAKTCLVLATNLVEVAFTNSDIGQKMGTTLEEFAKNLKDQIIPLIRDISETIGDDFSGYEERLQNNQNPTTGRPSL